MTEDDELTAPLASQEVALCGSEIQLLQTMINYVRQFPKAFKRQA